MADAIRHRGPDGEGYLLHRPGDRLAVSHGSKLPSWQGAPPTVGFAHLRLSILDLSERADQPMIDAKRGLTLLFNGEIYNYLELRRELIAMGHEIRSSGDSEVLLAAYAEWGPACVERLVGMWAFAVLDARNRRLFLSVDRFGIKPLYYAVAGGTLYFASEIKALMAVPEVQPEPDEDVMRRYLLTGITDESPRTFFAGVRRLRGAHNITLPLDAPLPEPRPECYWSVPEGPSYTGTRNDAAAEFAARLFDSVSLHARSDVPVGTCLSGGLDSSGIVCVADELRRSGRIPNYAHSGFGYIPGDEGVSERPFMEQVVDKTGLKMSYVTVSATALEQALPEVIRQQDEPFGSTSMAAQWFVFRAARRANLKVMLDGQGADELLGGYLSYLTIIGASMLRNWKLLRYRHFASQTRALTGAPPVPARAALGLMATRVVGFVRRRLRPGAFAGPAPPPSSKLLSTGLRSRLVLEDYDVPQFDSIHEILASQTMQRGLPALLRFEDRNSMAHSIEARVPFLDHRLVEFAFSLPGEFKIHGVETKYPLREGLRGILPEGIRARKDKIGFRADPGATWALAEQHRDLLLSNGTPYEERWFDTTGIERVMSTADRSAEAEFMLWRVLNTKLWLRSFWGGERDSTAVQAALR